jgi:hypothetical protein
MILIVFEKEESMAAKRFVLWLGMLIAFSMSASTLGQKGRHRQHGGAGNVDKGEGKGKHRAVRKRAGSSSEAKTAEERTPGEAQPGERLGALRGEHVGRGDGPGRGRALGRDKPPGEGPATGEDQGIGDGDGAAARAARRARHLERVRTRREAIKNRPGHKGRFEAGMARQGPLAKEQRKHLKRMAKLRRLLALAGEQQNEALTAKLGALREKEQDRHRRVMDRMRDKEPKTEK